MTGYRLISADSHVSEPTDLWVERVDKKYRDRAPRLVANPADPNGAYFYYEGHPLHPIGIGLGAGDDLPVQPEGRRPGARALREAGPQRRDDLVLAARGAAVQLGRLRSVLGGRPGNADARQPALHHRDGA